MASASPAPSSSTSSYNHLPTHLPSPTHPILLRTLEPEDNAAFAAILSDPRNTAMESAEVARSSAGPPMELSVATGAIARMRDSAAQPTLVVPAAGGAGAGGRGKVLSGPGRVNLAIVYLGDEGTEEGDELRRKGGLVIGLGGFGGIKDLSPSSTTGGENIASREDGNMVVKTRVGDVGAMVNPEYRGRGFAKEAVRIAMEWGFRDAAAGGLQLDRVTATTLARNEAMVKVLDRFGWKGEPKTDESGAEELGYEMGWEEWQKRS